MNSHTHTHYLFLITVQIMGNLHFDLQNVISYSSACHIFVKFQYNSKYFGQHKLNLVSQRAASAKLARPVYYSSESERAFCLM